MRWQVACAAMVLAGILAGEGGCAKKPAEKVSVTQATRPVFAAASDAQVKDAAEKGATQLLGALALVEGGESDGQIERIATAYRAVLIVGQLSSNANFRSRRGPLASAQSYLLIAKPTSLRTCALRLRALNWAKVNIDQPEIHDRLKTERQLSVLRLSQALLDPETKIDLDVLYIIADALANLPESQPDESVAKALLKRIDPATLCGSQVFMTAEATQSLTLGVLREVSTRLATRQWMIQQGASDQRNDAAIARGLEYLNGHFWNAWEKIPSVALEYPRVIAEYTGRQRYAGENWQDRLSNQLVAEQNRDGTWAGGVRGTAEAAAFLAQARLPMFMAILQPQGAELTRSADGMRNLSAWVGKLYCEYPLQWEAVRFSDPLSQWMESRVLLITGADDPKWTKEEVARLRDYVQAGGLIFTVSEGNSEAFTHAMIRYASVCGENKYEVRELSKEHPLLNDSLRQIKAPPRLYGLSNGVRELWIHSPVDVRDAWENNKMATRPDDFILPMNIKFYASRKTYLNSRFASLAPVVTETHREPGVGKMTLARVRYTGNATPEPQALKRFAARAIKRGMGDLTVVDMSATDLDANKTPIAFVSGTGGFQFKSEEVDALKNYVSNGGLLVFEASGGNQEMNAALAKLFWGICPDGTMRAVKTLHPLFLGSPPWGYTVNKPEIRSDPRSPTLQADFLAFVEDDDMKILFSPLDFSSGLLGLDALGISGYSPETSEQLMTNLILWVAGGKH